MRIKYPTAGILSIEAAEHIYKEAGLALEVEDGEYIVLINEEK